jgi:hypothetical protein
MKLARAARVQLTTLAAMAAPLILAPRAWAQTHGSPSPGATPSTEAMGNGGVVVVLVIIGLIAVLGIAVKVSDLRRRRTDAAVALQGRIADALLADPALGHQPIVATAITPFWGRSPVILEVGGPVPSAELREAAMSLVIREAFNSGLRFRVEDRIVVDPRMSRAAAA